MEVNAPAHLGDPAPPKPSKPPVIRGARACTICRAAKMKCVGSDDGQQPCLRCRRSNTECIFEKHRRGRKPGSKLSEASKMLRRLEKGLNTAKAKQQASENPTSESRLAGLGDAHMRLVQLSQADPSQYRSDANGRRAHFGGSDPYHPQLSGSSSVDEDENDGEPNEEGVYPAKLIKKERQRNSFFGTVLGPSGSGRSAGENGYPAIAANNLERSSYLSEVPQQISSTSIMDSVDDPVQHGLMDEATAENIIDLVLIRLNPFINLFDPELHSASYIRRKSAFLYTTLLMAGSKFFKSQLYTRCRDLAERHAVKAFAEQHKSVEVVQAFMCLTYWKEPDNTRTWTYIGYACRMAVELGLNRYVQRPPDSETNLQRLERRNRERTYLVLFVHDRSLSMQTGRLWMLPEDELVIESYAWHDQVAPGNAIRPEDVIVCAFVALRLIATETTKLFEFQKGSINNAQLDNFDFLLNACNSKLASWSTQWSTEMKRASGAPFHHSFLEFFQSYVGLFLNSFGIHAYMSNSSTPSPSLQALTTCFTNASRCLEIVVKEFARVQMLQYGQESTTTMTAYCAVMLLRLLQKSNMKADEASTTNVLSLILSVSDAYKEAGTMMPSSSSCAAHARFLRTLVEREELRARQSSREMDNIDPSLQQYPPYTHPSGNSTHNTPVHLLPNGTPSSAENTFTYHPQYAPTPQTLLSPQSGKSNESSSPENVFVAENFPAQSQADNIYYDNICRELGMSQGVDLIHGSSAFYPRLPAQQTYQMMGH